MIIVFPALTSNTVDGHILPGIAKALESYAITYLLENVLSEQTNKKISVKNKRIFMEQYKGMPDQSQQGASPTQPKKPGVAPTPSPGGNNNEVKIDKPTSNELSLPPTWVRVDTPNGTKIIGVKVLPFRVKSDEDFVNAMGSDLARSGFLDHVFTKIGRLMRRFVHKFYKKGIEGDVEKDLLFAQTKFGKNLFCIYDFMSVKNISSDPKLVRKLFNFYWSSLIFADDANQIAYFCMKNFSGICNAIPYRFLHTLTSQVSDAYDNLNDANSASNSIFRVKKKQLTKILGEAHAANKVIEYTTQLLEKD